MSNFRRVDNNANSLGTDAWGRNKAVLDKSLFHGINTMGIQKESWKKLLNGNEVVGNGLDTYIRDENGSTKVTSTILGARNTLQSLQHPGYQPNRGHLFSDSSWIPNANNGKFGLVVRTMTDGTVSERFTEIGTMTGATLTVDGQTYDITKGNVHDIQIQWRGVGNFETFINLQDADNNEVLGTLNGLSVSNPSLPVRYEAIKGGHTLGGLARVGSAVRLGIGTEENAIMLEYQYTDDADAVLYMGCCDITSEGGDRETQTLGSVVQKRFPTHTGTNSTEEADEFAVLAFRVPETRTVNGTVGTYQAYNTRDIQIKGLDIKANDEGDFALYRTRNPNAIVANTWVPNWSDDVEFAVGLNGAANQVTNFLPSEMDELYFMGVEQDHGRPVDLKDDNLWATNGDYYILTYHAANNGVGDNVSASIKLGVEK